MGLISIFKHIARQLFHKELYGAELTGGNAD